MTVLNWNIVQFTFCIVVGNNFQGAVSITGVLQNVSKVYNLYLYVFKSLYLV
jgi:hypothetical protein